LLRDCFVRVINVLHVAHPVAIVDSIP